MGWAERHQRAMWGQVAHATFWQRVRLAWSWRSWPWVRAWFRGRYLGWVLGLAHPGVPVPARPRRGKRSDADDLRRYARMIQSPEHLEEILLAIEDTRMRAAVRARIEPLLHFHERAGDEVV